MMKKPERINLNMTPGLKERIHKVAKQYRLSRTSLMRILLQEGLQFYEDTYVEPVREEYVIRLTEKEHLRLQRIGFAPTHLKETE